MNILHYDHAISVFCLQRITSDLMNFLHIITSVLMMLSMMKYLITILDNCICVNAVYNETPDKNLA